MGTLSLSATSFTKITDSEFGDKRIWIGTATLGNGADNWPGASGIGVIPSWFDMDKVEEIIFDGGTLSYHYTFNESAPCYIHAYTAHGTPDPAQIMILSTAITSDSIRIMVIGRGGG